MWRALFAIGKAPHKVRQGAGKDLTWAIIEKTLFRQKMMLMCALEKESIEDLNGRAVGFEKIGIEKAVLDRCTELPRIFKEDYDQSASSRKPVASDRVIGSMKSSEYISRTSTWEEARFGMMTPEPRTAECEFWLEVPRGANVYLCDRCASGNDATFYSNTTNPHSCLNCSANWSRDSAYGIGKDELFIMQQLGRVAGRLYDVYSKDAGWTSMKAKHDLRSFLVAATEVFKFSTDNKELKDLHKTISNLGTLRVPVYHFANRCRQGHCRRVGVIREVRTIDVQERYFYQMTYDGGNVAYKDFLTALLTEDEYIGLFRGKSRSETSAEGMGDIVECWMGILTLGTYFPKLFERWGDQLEECRHGLESSFWTYQAACRDSTTDNTKDGRQHYIDGDIPAADATRVIDILKRHDNIWEKLNNGEVHRMTRIPNVYDHNADETSSDSEDEGSGYPMGASGRISKDDANMSDETGGIAEPAHDDEPMEQPTKRRKIEGVEKLSEKFEEFIDESRRVKFCLHCYGNHFISECDAMDANDTMQDFEGLQVKLQDGTIGEPDAPPTKSGSAPSSSAAPPPRKGNGHRSDHDRFAPRGTGVHAQLKGKKINLTFMNATALSDIQDRYEGGTRLANGVKVDDLGPQNKRQFDYVINRAGLLTRVDDQLPSVAELIDTTPNQWSRTIGAMPKSRRECCPQTW
eukprot:s184_g26.t1